MNPYRGSSIERTAGNCGGCINLRAAFGHWLDKSRTRAKKPQSQAPRAAVSFLRGGNSRARSTSHGSQMFEKWQQEMDKGNVAMTMRDFASAETHFALAAKEAEKFGHNNLSLALSLDRHAESLIQQAPLSNEQVEVCVNALERACNIYEAAHGPINLKVAELLNKLARIIIWFDADQSEKLARRSISIYEELRSDSVADPIEMLATVLLVQERRDERRETLENYVRKYESMEGASGVALGRILITLACSITDDDKAVLKHYQRAVELLSDVPEQTKKVIEVKVQLGKMLFKEQRFSEAERMFESVIEQGECLPDVHSTTIEEAICRLARLHCCFYEDFDKARRLLKRAEEIRDPEAIPPFGTGIDIENSNLASATGDYSKYEEITREDLRKVREKMKNVSEADYVSTLGFTRPAIELANILERKGAYEEAFQLWEECANFPTVDEWVIEPAKLKLASAYVERGQIEKGRQLADWGLTRINNDTSDDALMLSVIAECKLGRIENTEKSIAILEQRLAELPDDYEDHYRPLPYLNLVIAYGVAGRDDDVKRTLQAMFDDEEDISIFRAMAYEGTAKSLDGYKLPEYATTLRERAREHRVKLLEREQERKRELEPGKPSG